MYTGIAVYKGKRISILCGTSPDSDEYPQGDALIIGKDPKTGDTVDIGLWGLAPGHQMYTYYLYPLGTDNTAIPMFDVPKLVTEYGAPDIHLRICPFIVQFSLWGSAWKEKT